MAYNGLTKLGAEYLSKCIANNKSVVFKKVKVGDGDIPIGATGQETTALYSQKKEVEILSKEQVENAVKLTILLNNLDLTQGFYVKEMGIFIEDDGVEKLYWYINKDNPSFLPDKNNPSKHRYNVYCEVSSSESIVVNFTGQGLLVDKKYVDDSIKVIENNFNTLLKKKLDKGNVSAEYDTAKKIEDKIKEVKKTADEKVSKSGDTMTGKLLAPTIQLTSSSTSSGGLRDLNGTNLIRYGRDSVIDKDVIVIGDSDKLIYMDTDEPEYLMNRTNSGEGVIYSSLYPPFFLSYQPIGNISTDTDILTVIRNSKAGLYGSNTGANKFINLPDDLEPARFWMDIKSHTSQGYTYKIATIYSGNRPTKIWRGYQNVNPSGGITWSGWLEDVNVGNDTYLRLIGRNVDNKITYIQDAGDKQAGVIYKDKDTRALYKCINDNRDIFVSNNFEIFSMAQNARNANFNKAVTLYERSDIPSSTSKRTVTLNDKIDNYQMITIEFAKTSVGDNRIQLHYITNALSYSDATGTDGENEYMVGIRNADYTQFYFRTNKNQIYISLDSTNQTGYAYYIRRVYGIRKY